MRNEHVVEYWLAAYVQDGMCSLCAQAGFIDTRGATTPAGFFCGRVNFCICPNGQTMRRVGQENGWNAEVMLESYKHRTNKRLKDV